MRIRTWMVVGIMAWAGCGGDDTVPTRDAATGDGGASDGGGDGSTDASTSPANLGLSDTVHDFSGVLVGTTSAFSVMVLNRGGSPSLVPTTAFTGTDASQYSVTGCTAPIAPADACTLSVTFAPTSRGQKIATLGVSAGGLSIGNVTLTGIGLRPATLTANPPSKAYFSAGVNMDGVSQAFTITNDGDVSSVALTTTLTGTNPGDFIIGTQTCAGATLAPAGTCTIPVLFHPTALGSRTANLLLMAGGGVMTTVALSGVGAPVLEGSPASHDFGTVTATLTLPGPQIWTVTNHGTTALTLTLTTGGNTGDFSLGGGTTSCPTTTGMLAAGQSCVLEISPHRPGIGNTGAKTETVSYGNGTLSTTITVMENLSLL